jgi:hypothetical protein
MYLPVWLFLQRWRTRRVVPVVTWRFVTSLRQMAGTHLQEQREGFGSEVGSCADGVTARLCFYLAGWPCRVGVPGGGVPMVKYCFTTGNLQIVPEISRKKPHRCGNNQTGEHTEGNPLPSDS